MKLIALCSGGGGTVKRLHKMFNKSTLSRQNSCEFHIIADRKCGALEWGCVTEDVQAMQIDWTRDEQFLARHLLEQAPCIALTLVHRILSEHIININGVDFINTHYSLLPSFKGSIGMKTLSRAIEAGCSIMGATSHIVTKELDSGPIISQVAFNKQISDCLEDLQHAMFISGCLSTYLALQSLLHPNVITKSNKNNHTFSAMGKSFLLNPGISDGESSDLLTALREQ